MHSFYVFSLPTGPIWALHTFYLVTSILTALLYGDRDDPIHKATGWMLRYVGEVDRPRLNTLHAAHAATTPRTPCGT